MNLPVEIVTILSVFAPLFSERVWIHAETLAVGAILAVGKRTVTSALRVMGKSNEEHFTNYHRVLNRDKWDGRKGSQIVLGLIICLVPGVLVVGADDTLERRRGRKIKGIGCYRDAVRSTKKYVVKCFGLKWVSMMALIAVPWSKRVWALPFFTVMCWPEKKAQKDNKKISGRKKTKPAGKTTRHKTSVDIVRQMIKQVSRWLPQRMIVLVVDGGFAAVSLALACVGRPNVVMVSRMRMDAALYHKPGKQPAGKRGRKPLKGKRQRSLAIWAVRSDTPWQEREVNWYGGECKKVKLFSQTALWYTPGYKPVEVRYVIVRDPEGELRDEAFFCTKLDAAPEQIIEWVVMRWSVETTFEEGRAHIGIETQRQWADKAIARSTPVLFGLFSLVTLMAMKMYPSGEIQINQASWYKKEEPTFSDCIALLRRRIWQARYLMNSGENSDIINFPRKDFELLINSLPWAA
jgi:DDE superfamily endonuclease